MVFSLGCLKKSLLALVAVSLLVSIGQLVLIFINNKIFGAIMFVMYILFFLAILLALCRDSVSMYAACTVLLIVFVIGCSLIQAYDVEVKDLLKLESTTTEESSTEETTPTTPTTPDPKRRRDVLHQMLQSEAQWKPQGQVTAWPPAEDRLPMYPVNSQPIPMEAPPDQRQAQQSFDYQPAPSLPPQPTLLPPNVPELTIYPKYEPRQGARQGETTPPPPPPPDPPEPEPEEPQKKKYRWRNELRWVSNVLGVLHILILAVVICILYEMLFGGRYRYRTWC